MMTESEKIEIEVLYTPRLLSAISDTSVSSCQDPAYESRSETLPCLGAIATAPPYLTPGLIPYCQTAYGFAYGTGHKYPSLVLAPAFSALSADAALNGV